MKPIISVEGLGKSYTIRHEGQTRYKSLREELFKLPKRLLSRSGQSQEEFWALKDVNFDIMPGERVGIIGRNGAGKSTLLKLLSRITEPTTGRITLRGRVASLLEVGTGFHPELTGRENIFLNGAILGMSRAEVRRKFDEIVDFAGVEKFLDTPVKRYSSGMYVRLAFAVAAHLEPEILIVDEVLAVGDAEFQKKCLGKMEDAGREGRTVLFVSHNIAAIMSLCTRAIYLHSGTIKIDSSVKAATTEYFEEIDSKNRQLSEILFENSEKNDKILKKLSIKGMNQSYCNRFNVFDDIVIEVVVENNSLVSNIHVGLSFFNNQGVRVASIATWMFDQEGISVHGMPQKIIFKIKKNMFMLGQYRISLYASCGSGRLDYEENAGMIKINPTDELKNVAEELGVVYLDGTCDITNKI